jgi:lysozyme
MIRGIDISSFQGRSIDWAKVAADPDGPKYVYAKASEGVTGQDSTFAVHVSGARAAGLLVGACHFAHSGDPDAQAINFGRAAGRLGSEAGDLPPMFDVERSPSPPNKETAEALLDAIETSWGCLPLVYGGRDYLGQLGLDAHCPLMIAAYPPELAHAWPGDSAKVPQMAPWGMPRFWQFSDRCYQLPGAGPVDSSVFLGTLDELRAMCAGSRV